MTLERRILDRTRRMAKIRIDEIRKNTELTISIINSSERVSAINRRIFDKVSQASPERVSFYQSQRHEARVRLFENNLNHRIEQGVWYSLKDAHRALGSPPLDALADNFKRFISEYASQESGEVLRQLQNIQSFSIDKSEVTSDSMEHYRKI